tara:strand:+ start:272 stop:376 length:105 start_codon:yes stop_codon:yes gene_type:complete
MQLRKFAAVAGVFDIYGRVGKYLVNTWVRIVKRG